VVSEWNAHIIDSCHAARSDDPAHAAGGLAVDWHCMACKVYATDSSWV